MPQIESLTDVLIVGAGPTGLAAAADALRHGLSVRIVERLAERAPYSKALVLHARTMEVLELLDCADELLAVGARFRALHVHSHPGRPASTIDLLNRNWGDTVYPFWLSVPQYVTEQVLEKRVEVSGTSVDWSTELVGLKQHPEHVEATLEGPDGTQFVHRARWVLGCDGGRSATRELSGLSLSRTDLGVSFALADVKTTSALPGDEGHMVWSSDGLLLIVPMPEEGVWRLIAHVDEKSPELDTQGWQELVQGRSGIDLNITSTGWNSKFRLSSGVSPTLRQGRVFLLGDAAHVHSPVGGQGLNTGIQDAHNLVWKLALVEAGGLAPQASNTLLDSYAAERHPIAVTMVRATSMATRILTVRHWLGLGLRRTLGRFLLRSDWFKDNLGRGVGMLDLLTDGALRLPNPKLSEAIRLYDRVRPTRPIRLKLADRDFVVRPDRVAAPPGTWPLLDSLDLETLEVHL